MKNNFQKRDNELITINELSDRINSLGRQIEKMDAVWNPRNWQKHNEKAIKLNQRRDNLWNKRAALLKIQKAN